MESVVLVGHNMLHLASDGLSRPELQPDRHYTWVFISGVPSCFAYETFRNFRYDFWGFTCQWGKWSSEVRWICDKQHCSPTNVERVCIWNASKVHHGFVMVVPKLTGAHSKFDVKWQPCASARTTALRGLLVVLRFDGAGGWTSCADSPTSEQSDTGWCVLYSILHNDPVLSLE